MPALRMRNLAIALAGIALATGPAFAAATPEWTAKVRQLLAAKQEYPRAAQMRGDEGTAKVKLDVAADGSVAGVELVQPSGSSALDREALAVPKKVGAFPAPPGGAASLVVPLTWKMM
ncbi:protein TonB [Sphingomonas sp. YR710]|uniref:energy transducer TonB n=1 Tax=Sphingomonas sp. YR710 TaxID=1882773 RepID=UPI00088779D9|nr:energy transducer TonB [Sphingomonas sp. YR710]SDC23860.1 protein TonB [Sphingomonas sp. YR710]